jgi:cytochrome b
MLLLLVGATVVAGAIRAEEIHELIAWTLLALVAVHVGAVIAMSFLSRENLVSAMIGGTKTSRLHPAAKDAKPAGALAFPLVILVLAGTVWGILSYDPRAFTLRSTEDYEHRGEVGAAHAGASEADNPRRDDD